MSQWFRMYNSVVHDPKVQRLPAELFKGWVNLLCIASENDGFLPPIEDIAYTLHTTMPKIEKLVDQLSESGLLDELGDGSVCPHNWKGRQFQSDSSTERVRRYRTRHKKEPPRSVGKRDSNVSCNVSSAVSETLPETIPKRDETVSVTPPDTERKKERVRAHTRAELAHTREDTGYFFESGVIRLKEKAFLNWEKAFQHLDLRAELTSLAPWAGEPEQRNRWFIVVSAALGNRNSKAGIKKEQAKNGQDGGWKWKQGEEGVL